MCVQRRRHHRKIGHSSLWLVSLCSDAANGRCVDVWYFTKIPVCESITLWESTRGEEMKRIRIRTVKWKLICCDDLLLCCVFDCESLFDLKRRIIVRDFVDVINYEKSASWDLNGMPTRPIGWLQVARNDAAMMIWITFIFSSSSCHIQPSRVEIETNFRLLLKN